MSEELLSCDEAWSIVKKVGDERKALILGRSESILIVRSAGRILAEDLRVRVPNPSFNNSAMDGYLTRSEWTVRASELSPLRLLVKGCIAAGDNLDGAYQNDPCAFQVMTGAEVPEGFDAVIRQENACLEKESGNTFLVLKKAIEKWDQIRVKGEDLIEGEIFLQKNTKLNSAHVMALASQGIKQVKVVSPIQIGLICTGSEIVSHEIEPGPSKLRNLNAPFLEAYLKDPNIEFTFLGNVQDLAADLKLKIESAVNKFDVILTSGAVSVGKFDIVRPVLEEIGTQIHFHKIALRPGKPLLFAEFKGGAVFMGFPGNPISSAVAARFFLNPLLRRMLNSKDEVPKKAFLKNDVKCPSHLSCFWRVQEDSENAEEVYVFQGQESFRLRTFFEASHWMMLPAGQSEFRKGECVQKWPLEMNV